MILTEQKDIDFYRSEGIPHQVIKKRHQFVRTPRYEKRDLDLDSETDNDENLATDGDDDKGNLVEIFNSFIEFLNMKVKT